MAFLYMYLLVNDRSHIYHFVGNVENPLYWPF